jgi:hypothetical protein
MSTSKTDRETRNPRSAARAVAKLTRPVSERYDHIRGPIDAPVKLVEYGIMSARIAASPITS